MDVTTPLLGFQPNRRSATGGTTMSSSSRRPWPTAALRVWSVLIAIISFPFRVVYGCSGAIESFLLRRDNPVLNVLTKALFCNPTHPMLIFVLIAFVVSFFGNPSEGLTFLLHFLGIIPLSAVLGYATEQLALNAGPGLGGFINVTLGNAVEFVIAVAALKQGQISIVQASMLGSILSNILLVLGCCIICGSMSSDESEVAFNSTAASAMSTIMLVSCISLILPTGLADVFEKAKDSAGSLKSGLDAMLLYSRGTSILLVFVYIVFLFFSFSSHEYLFNPKAALSASRSATQNSELENGGPRRSATVDMELGMAADEESEEEPEIGTWSAVAILVVVTGIIALSAEYLVESIDGIVEGGYFTETFIGLILLPIVGNAAEHASSCIVAYKGQMDLAVQIAVGSSIQIALGMTPLLVLLAWAMGEQMTLHFQVVETIALFVSVLLVTFIIQDGKTNYFEGVMCIVIYIMIGLAFWVYPDEAAVPETVYAVVNAVLRR